MTPIIAFALVALFLALGAAAVADTHARHGRASKRNTK